MLVCGVDFESNGTDLETLRITEIGAVLRDTETKEIIETLSTLVWDESYPPLEPHIVELTGITDEMLREKGISPTEALEKLQALIRRGKYAVAYNKVFDENVNAKVCGRANVMPALIEWICIYTEVPYPDKYRCRQLAHLAFDHGIKMDHRELHRASDDVTLMFELADMYGWDVILAYAKEPWVTVQACIPGPWIGKGGDGGIGKAEATKRGYGWEKARGTDAPVFSKMWVKRIKEGQLVKETTEAPFRIVKLT